MGVVTWELGEKYFVLFCAAINISFDNTQFEHPVRYPVAKVGNT